MLCITKIDVLIVGLVLFAALNIAAVIFREDVGILTVTIGGCATIIGYAFIRPPNGTVPCFIQV
jgi:hypothetical protein